MEHIHCQLKKAMAKVGKYCVQDSVLVADILNIYKYGYLFLKCLELVQLQ